MALEAAKCPNCGAAIQVPDERESASCMYCGSILKVKEAIEKFKIELSGSVIVETSIEPMLKSAEGFLMLKRWDDAEKLFRKIIELNSTDYRAWWGLVSVYTKNFTDFINENHTEFYGSALELADLPNRNKLEMIYREYCNNRLEYVKLRRKYHAEVIYFDSSTNSIMVEASKKSRKVALILSIPPFGVLGFHRFYVGKFGTGLLWPITVGGLYIGWLIDLIMITRGTFTDYKGKPLLKW